MEDTGIEVCFEELGVGPRPSPRRTRSSSISPKKPSISKFPELHPFFDTNLVRRPFSQIAIHSNQWRWRPRSELNGNQFSTDKGSQHTSSRFCGKLKAGFAQSFPARASADLPQLFCPAITCTLSKGPMRASSGPQKGRYPPQPNPTNGLPLKRSPAN